MAKAGGMLLWIHHLDSSGRGGRIESKQEGEAARAGGGESAELCERGREGAARPPARERPLMAEEARRRRSCSG